MPRQTTTPARGLHRVTQHGAVALLVLGSLLGCEPQTPIAASPPPLPFANVPPELTFIGTLAGTEMRLVVDDCKVYRNSQDPQREQDWHKVLETEPYPFAYCHRQNLRVENNLISVDIGDMAFGAGGCCATGGSYTSTDGLVWKRH